MNTRPIIRVNGRKKRLVLIRRVGADVEHRLATAIPRQGSGGGRVLPRSDAGALHRQPEAVLCVLRGFVETRLLDGDRSLVGQRRQQPLHFVDGRIRTR